MDVDCNTLNAIFFARGADDSNAASSKSSPESALNILLRQKISTGGNYAMT